MKTGKNKVVNKRVISNNLFMLKILWKGSPVYTIALIIEAVRHDGMVFLEHAYSINFVLEAVEFHKPFHTVLSFLSLLLFLMALSGLYTNFFQHYIEIKYLPRIQQELKLQLYEKAKELDLACYDDPDYYNEFVLAVSEAEQSIERASKLLRMLFSGVTIFICYGLFFFTMDITSILFVIATYILRTIFKGMSNKLKFRVRLRENVLERRRSYVQRVFYLNEYAKELRLNKEASARLHEKFEENNKELYKLQKEVAKKRLLLETMANYISTDFIMDVLYISYLVYKAAVLGAISYSNVVVLYNSAGSLRRGLSTLTDILPQASELSLYVEKIRTFLAYEKKIISEQGLPVPGEPKKIELKDVSFAYNDHSSNIINHLSMTIKPYQKIALVGYNGAGKTTLTKLLMRLYDVKEGSITLDNVDIRSYDVEAYRDSIGAVFQDYKIYAATVRENVIMDHGKYGDKEKVYYSLEKSGFRDKLDTLPAGIDSRLTREFDEDGVDLSGGESQKLAVARGFYKDTSLIILDEPSSALDPIAEYNLNRFMFEAAKDKTVIFISHRLSTTRKADRIYMMEQGQIIEEGTHEELLKMSGKYAQMWNAQALKYTD